jgi:hypothetical protein
MMDYIAILLTYTSSPTKPILGVWWDSFSLTNLGLLTFIDKNYNYEISRLAHIF